MTTAVFAIGTCVLLVSLIVSIIHWVAAVPLARTLTTAIDTWAESVHGGEAEAPREIR